MPPLLHCGILCNCNAAGVAGILAAARPVTDGGPRAVPSMKRIGAAILGLVLAVLAGGGPAGAAEDWSKKELKALRSLWIGSLPKLPPDPTNPVADDPRAAAFGHHLFFDTRLSANGNVACVTCHNPTLAFTDGRKTSRGIGVTARNAPTLIGAAYNSWFFWDGRKDSQWSQALGPLENPLEQGSTRGKVVAVVRGDPGYRRRYEALFGKLPAKDDKEGVTRAFANIGRVIAAYERKLVPAPAKFDRYVAAVLQKRTPKPADTLTLDEAAGLRAFISEYQGRCMTCHSGPLFTDHKFHNIGFQDRTATGAAKEGEEGRLSGVRKALADAFNCAGLYSDLTNGPGATACAKKLADAPRSGKGVLGAFKTPTLRNVTRTAPYMHTGEVELLNFVIWHYRNRPHAAIGESELEFLTLAPAQFDQIEAFLHTLESPVAAPAKYLQPPEGD
jgi:cytochrome c peroxidase